ncbi:hypothetical protein jhhlp_003477 [Lomentospora prolificans]|uniref:Helicase ATP-binding domain-containing protein n=1 Tax=Lomentospora prolificans TaxID=41688 RepID=A0A2N3N8U7_9PEZI|nr:hypothetical protein jhhlp_003477 [Lomentospora prolificans]
MSNGKRKLEPEPCDSSPLRVRGFLDLEYTRPGTAPPNCTFSWPEPLKDLERVHSALNLVFTFCCTRKHVITTLDSIKSTVESHIGRTLTAQDVAAVAAIRPDAINFSYANEASLRLDIKGSERDTIFKHNPPKAVTSQGPPTDLSVGGVTGLSNLVSAPGVGCRESDRDVLFFEFTDGDPKPHGEKKQARRQSRRAGRVGQHNLTMPAFNPTDLRLLIERRNRKFRESLSAFIDQCSAENVDPVKSLNERALLFIPQRPAHVETDSQDVAASTIIGGCPKRMPIRDIIIDLKECPWYSGQIVPDGHRVFEPQEAVYGDLEFLLSQNVVNALYNAKGIVRLYSHQADALNHLHSGSHVVVSTSTSSGKSLIYQLPILHTLEQDTSSRAMFIFPTKALAQDQKRSLRELLSYMPGLEDVRVETFDGDTPFSERVAIRENASVIFTNPDMLHITILPTEERWRTFFQSLKYVVGM